MKIQYYLYFIISSVMHMLSASKKNTVGGQAIIEGVMMRGKNKISWAVRKNPQEVVIEQENFVSIVKKYPVLKTPVIRGAINLYESLVIGFKALSRSAEIAEAEINAQSGNKEKKVNPVLEKLYSFLSLSLSLVIMLGLFMYAPMWIFSNFVPKESALLFNILAGVFRIILFLGYLYLISKWKEIRRVFEYHGAEHKAIFAFEDGKDLTLENMKPYSTLHPRCGTSFLFLVGFICILLFSIVDALYISFFGPFPNVLFRFFIHIFLIPLVSGTSYEVLKLSDRYQNIAIVRTLIKPGLWLQKITTKEPDRDQLEVASLALKAVI